MRTHQLQHTARVYGHLHRSIYEVMVGLAAWLVFSVWLFFDKGSTGLPLAVVSIFVLISVMLPVVLWRIRRHNRAAAEPGDGESFPAWLSGEFETWPGRVGARDAALEILLPIAAVALGMTLFAVVLHFDVGATS
jgi:hypothetical protein